MGSVGPDGYMSLSHLLVLEISQLVFLQMNSDWSGRDW